MLPYHIDFWSFFAHSISTSHHNYMTLNDDFRFHLHGADWRSFFFFLLWVLLLIFILASRLVGDFLRPLNAGDSYHSCGGISRYCRVLKTWTFVQHGVEVLFMGVDYVDNTRVLEQWYPLILVLSDSFYSCLQLSFFAVAAFLRNRDIHIWFRFLLRRRYTSLHTTMSERCTSIHRVHCPFSFSVADWLSQSMSFGMEHMVRSTRLSVFYP